MEDCTNPVTRSLLQELDRPDIAEFVTHWDRLEAALIALYRGVPPGDGGLSGLKHSLGWLVRRYPAWSERLAPHWVEHTRDQGLKDPFAAILAVDYAEPTDVTWETLKTLPYAREALNSWLLELIEAQSRHGSG